MAESKTYLEKVKELGGYILPVLGLLWLLKLVLDLNFTVSFGF